MRNFRIKTVGGSDNQSIAGFPDAPVAHQSAMAGGAELQVGGEHDDQAFSSEQHALQAGGEHHELPNLDGGARRRRSAKRRSAKKSPRRHSPKKSSPRRHAAKKSPRRH